LPGVLRRRTGRTLDGPVDPAGEPSGLTAQLADAVIRRLLDSPLADTLIDRVVQALMRSGELDRLVAKLLSDLEDSPAVDSLVDRQVERVLEALRESPALRTLIRDQAGAYLTYLGEHPAPVQRLIQEQSRGVVDEFLSALRQRGLEGDDAVDRWVHRALGLT
jgi:hypothetical protein